ncbi:hypothetical protein Lepto7375DRAFT_3304 [Leptolyngbya sp. PCC 7375]|nr:hypothetical protein Lepto7375DRAFT_3304 [Leptolyngbya sp. PCC 7375]
MEDLATYDGIFVALAIIILASGFIMLFGNLIGVNKNWK